MKRLLVLWALVVLVGLIFMDCKGQEVQVEENKYSIRIDSVYVPSGQDSIFGILYTPDKTAGRFPAVICLQGGGDVGLDNYTYEPRKFAEQGMVALVCDKAGTGRSKGPSNWEHQTFNEKVEEYRRLMDWMRSLPQVKEDVVGVHGMSEGGRLAIALAGKYPDEIAFANSVVGPIESFKENQLYAIECLLNSRQVDSTTTERCVHIWNDYFDGIYKGDIDQSLIDEINALRSGNPSLYLPTNSTRIPIRPKAADIHFNTIDLVGDITCPVLFQFGELDVLVDTKTTLSLIPDKENFKIIEYKQTTHNMTYPNGDIHSDFISDKMIWLQEKGIVDNQ